MTRSRSPALATAAAAVLLMTAHANARGGQQGQPQQQQPPATGDQPSFRFKTGVELINVTATVTDENGRFVSGLGKDDFRVYQDEQLQTVTHFTNERVPVSLGIVLDDKDGAILSSANTYQIIGNVTSGMDTADAIFAASGGVELPANPIPITTATVANP